jgi:hypothetical protein
MRALEERGFIRRMQNRRQAIEVLRLPSALGMIAAEVPPETPWRRLPATGRWWRTNHLGEREVAIPMPQPEEPPLG